jgi:Leucine-rich repeat (LRR) protein
MLNVKPKLTKRFLLSIFNILFFTFISLSQNNEDIDNQKAQIEKEINEVTQSTNWQDPDESAKATQKLTELATKLSNLSNNQVIENLKNTEFDNSFNLGNEIISDFNQDNPEQKTNGTDSALTVLGLTKFDMDAFEKLDRLWDFPNLDIVYINGHNLDKTLDFSDIIEKLSVTKVKQLYIVGFSDLLTQLPDNIDKLPDLKVLALYGNSLTEIPETVFNLPALSELYLDANSISSIPLQAGKGKTLKVLGLIKTQVSKSELNRLKNLLSNCDIQN